MVDPKILNSEITFDRKNDKIKIRIVFLQKFSLFWYKVGT